MDLLHLLHRAIAFRFPADEPYHGLALLRAEYFLRGDKPIVVEP